MVNMSIVLLDIKKELIDESRTYPFFLQKQFITVPIFKGSFLNGAGDQFALADGGQFELVSGGQFAWIFQKPKTVKDFYFGK